MENKKNILKAISEFQQEVPVIHKDTQGFKNNYTYASLPKIFEVINPLLKKHGLGFTQLLEGNSIRTIVYHLETFETLESVAEIPQNVELGGMNKFQVLGSAITYFRRYALSSILGLVTDKDTDAQGEQITAQKPLPATQPAPQNEKKKEPEKWLNVGSPEWEGLVKTIADGSNWTLAQIRKKYKVSKETEKELATLNIT
jgi:recombination protein, phage associated